MASPGELVAFAAQTAVLVHLGTYAALEDLPASDGPHRGQQRIRHDALRKPSLRTLRGLDRALATSGHPTDLAGFASQILTVEGRFETRWEVSGELFDELTSGGGARTRSEALLRGASLASWVETRRGHRLDEQLEEQPPGGTDLPATVGDRRRARANDLVEELMTVVALPHGEGSQEAANILARIPEVALLRVRAHVLGEVPAGSSGATSTPSPMGWTGVRCLTAMLRYASQNSSSIDAVGRRNLASEVADVLREIDLQEDRLSNFGRSTSLWEEAAAELPDGVSGTDWLMPALCDRATGRPSQHGRRQLPVRERMTAAMVAYRRCSSAYARQVSEADRAVLEQLIEDLDASSHPDDDHAQREPALSYCATQIRFLLDGGAIAPPLAFSFPHGASHLTVEIGSGVLATRPEVDLVASFMRSEDIAACLGPVPRPARAAAAQLLSTAVLTPDAFVQRVCLETLVAAEIGGPAVRALRCLADRIQESPDAAGARWLDEHATACVAHIASRPEDAAWLQRVAFSRGRERRQRAIRITAIMGLASLAPKLRRIDNATSNASADRIASALGDDPNEYDKAERRAATYALALLHPTAARPQRTLMGLARSDDPITRDLALWAMARLLAHEPGEEEKGSERTRLVSPGGGWPLDVVDRFGKAFEARHNRPARETPPD